MYVKFRSLLIIAHIHSITPVLARGVLFVLPYFDVTVMKSYVNKSGLIPNSREQFKTINTYYKISNR